MPYLWLDLETTGLNPHTDVILEVAMMLTDDTGKELGRSQAVLPFKFDPVRGGIDTFVQKTHTDNGLWDACARATVSAEGVWTHLQGHLETTIGRVKDLYLAGNSIHFDRSFLAVHAPVILTYVSHRMLDMTSVALFADTLGIPRPPKGNAHRAMADVQESLKLFHYYRAAFAKSGVEFGEGSGI